MHSIIMTTTETERNGISFSHVHLYVDRVDDVLYYKHLEEHLNQLAALKQQTTMKELMKSKRHRMTTHFCSQHRDIVKQLLVAFGFRVTAVRFPNHNVLCNTRTVVISSRKMQQGVQFVITSRTNPKYHTAVEDHYPFFDETNLQRFYNQHAQRQGVAVLAFNVDNIKEIEDKYIRLHPKLLFRRFSRTEEILEVFAYYKADGVTADTGTVLRFIQTTHEPLPAVLPGLTPVEAYFPVDSQPAFCDHWVSNVVSRQSVLQILQDTLGFLPKVDFNAGVVAAGEAQIESTVTGNVSGLKTNDKIMALQDQSQVYLPINNALSEVGHVHGFLKELGQGIQHVASRVEDLVAFCQRANDYRNITGEGVSFLQIPRSYYGVLTMHQLETGAGVTKATAEAILEACHEQGIITSDGAVNLDLTRDEMDQRLFKHLKGCALEEYHQRAEYVLVTILKSRYINLHNLLKHHVSEKTYLGIVRNEILVDVQGDDLLYQIFTCNILQRHVVEEAPFLEFIQRVCSQCKDKDGCPAKIKPGCGGFGIRNFLTLFLSIEVSKAMMEVSHAKAKGDFVAQSFAQQRVDCFTAQLNESNPILTDISRAMTKEGNATEMMQEALAVGDAIEAHHWQSAMEKARVEKIMANDRLMECSSKYMNAMKTIRELHQERCSESLSVDSISNERT